MNYTINDLLKEQPAGVLYHGSQHKLTVLKPRTCGSFNRPLVFVSQDFLTSLGHSGNKWTDAILNQGSNNGVRYLLEMMKDAFKKTYSCKGYMHLISEKNFIDAPRLPSDPVFKLERYTDREVYPEQVLDIPDVLKCIKKSDIELHAYDRNGYMYKKAVTRMTEFVITSKHGAGYLEMVKVQNPDLYEDMIAAGAWKFKV